MIPKREILEIATNSNLSAHVIEKDYVLGWILAGINQHEIGKTWVFKGGTCLKKCYFETYRFSEDLDFTLTKSDHINAEFLKNTFNEISEWVYEQSGIEMPVDRLAFDIYENPRGATSCQAKIFYRGPVSPNSPKQMPRIKLDLSVDEVLVESAVSNLVNHTYSDLPDSKIHIDCYSYAEVFAEKIRALGERTRPRDLYDVINFYRRPESQDLADNVKSILKSKCDFKSIQMPSYEALKKHKDECLSGWEQQLSHQLQALPPFDSFWEELPDFFEWLYATNTSQARIVFDNIPPQQGSFSSGGPIDFQNYSIPIGQLSLLEQIRFAAANHLCIELDYRKENGSRNTYLIEPYTLNETSDGNLLLHSLKHADKAIRAFRTDRILGVKITNQPFIPQYRIDLVPRGPLNTNIKTSSKSLSSLHLPEHKTRIKSGRNIKSKLGNFGPKYIYQCPICQKKFTRKTMNGNLNPHKTKDSWPCSGRVGIFLETKY